MDAHAAAMAAASVPSTSSTSMPNRGQWSSKRAAVTEKSCFDATTRSPEEHRPSTTAVTAAMPDENDRPASAPSSAATASSNSRAVGLPKRE